MVRSLVRLRTLRRLLTWVGLAVCLFALYRLTPVLMSARVFQIDDYVEYWSAGRLNLAGSNPYAPDLMAAPQHAIGRTEVVMMWNPPMTLALVMPFAPLPYLISRLAWLLSQAAVILVSTAWLWELYGGALRKRWLAWLVAFLFSATLGALHKGQISPLILFGLAGFLRYERADRHWTAGAFAALAFLKPHLLYLFWIAWFFYFLQRRRWAGLVGAVAAMLAGTAVVMAFNPAVVGQYVRSALQDAPIWWHTPTLGGALRGLFGPEHRWLQFAPMLLGCGWLALQWRGSRQGWSWPDQLPRLVIVSVITAAYGWTYDQVVLLVMLLPAAHRLALLWRNPIARALTAIGVGINLADLALHGMWTDAAFWWLAPSWLAWYLGVRRWAAVSGAALKPDDLVRTANTEGAGPDGTR